MLLPLLLSAALQSTPAPPSPAPPSPARVVHQLFSAQELAALAAPGTGEILLAAPFAVRSVGFWWKGALPAAQARLLAADGSDSPFYPVAECPDLAPQECGANGPAGGAHLSALIHHYGSPAYALELDLQDLAGLDEWAVVWIAPAAGSAPQTSGLAAGAGYPKPQVYARSSWNADPPQCNLSYCSVNHVALHHTAGASEYNSPDWATSAANVKAIQAYHMYTRGWCDIGYNYLIDVHGFIFEGRAGGDDVRGAHDGFNCGSMGVAMMGYFHTPYNQVLKAAMKNAYAELSAWKCDQKGIDPFGSSWYAGYGGNMTNLYGHRDVSSTACPGDLAYADLPSLRQMVSDRLNGGGGSEIILDNDQALTVGAWNTGTSSGDKYGSSYLWASTGTSQAIAWWQPVIPQAGNWTLAYWWPQGGNRNPATRVGMRVNGRTYTGNVNQQAQGGQWNVVGTVWLPAGGGTRIGLDNSGTGGWVVIADAIRLQRQ